MVCGKEFQGTKAAFTCSGACRTAMSRILAEGGKPEYWLIAKGKGQKLPSTFFKTEPKKEAEKQQVKEPPKVEAEKTDNSLPDEPLTKEQRDRKIYDLEKKITETERQQCPLNQHPKSFKLNQQVKIEELKDEIYELKQQTT